LYDDTIKIIVFGDESPGKTMFIQKYLPNFFVSDKTMTVGVDFEVKSVTVDGLKVKLQVWDLGGVERWRFLLPTYVRGARGGLFLYDVTNYSSFAHIDDWLSVIRKEIRVEDRFPILAVGIVPDEECERQVTREEGIKIAKSRNLNGFIECNPKTGENVEKTFEALTRLMLDDLDQTEDSGDQRRKKEEDRALEIQPNIIRILIGKGLFLTKGYRFREALIEFNRVLEIDPANKIALENTSYIEKELQKRTAHSDDWLSAIRKEIRVNLVRPSIFREKQINQYITLKLKHGMTFIYVNGRRFIQCIRLSLNIQKENISLYDDIESIDEAAKVYKKTLLLNRIVQGPKGVPVRDQNHDITPEQEFWGHCSNIQAWVENEYDTRILMSNVSFPLLKKLSKAGDPLARKVYKEEIALRLESGYPSVVQYLLEQGFIGEFSPEEFETIVEYSDFIQKVSYDSRVLSLLLKVCNKKFPTLFEHIVLQILKLPEGYNALISAIQKDIKYPNLPKFLQFLTKLSTLKFLLKLKNRLGKLLNQTGEKESNQILSCIHAVNLQLGKHFLKKSREVKKWKR